MFSQQTPTQPVQIYSPGINASLVSAMPAVAAKKKRPSFSKVFDNLDIFSSLFLILLGAVGIVAAILGTIWLCFAMPVLGFSIIGCVVFAMTAIAVRDIIAAYRKAQKDC